VAADASSGLQQQQQHAMLALHSNLSKQLVLQLPHCCSLPILSTLATSRHSTLQEAAAAAMKLPADQQQSATAMAVHWIAPTPAKARRV
jgi:hypothetical protein